MLRTSLPCDRASPGQRFLALLGTEQLVVQEFTSECDIAFMMMQYNGLKVKNITTVGTFLRSEIYYFLVHRQTLYRQCYPHAWYCRCAPGAVPDIEKGVVAHGVDSKI